VDKKSLRQHAVTEADTNIVEFTNANAAKVIISAELTKEGILVINIFLKEDIKKGIYKPFYRVFCTNNDYVTQDLRSKKARWLTGCISSILERDIYYTYKKRVSYPWYNAAIIYDRKSVSILSNFFKTEDHLLRAIGKWQSLIMEKRLDDKKEKIRQKFNSIMSDIPELPNDFETWLNTTCVSQDNILYYEYAKQDTLKGFCTVCGNQVFVSNAKHNTTGICPVCGEQITYKASKRQKRNIVRTYGYILQKSKSGNGFWLRGFQTGHRTTPMQPRSDFWYVETYRWHFQQNGKVKIFELAYYGNQYRWGDCGREKNWLAPGALYESNLSEILKGSKYQYSALYEFATHQKGYKFFPHRFVWNYPEHKYIEYLIKLKLFRLAEDIFTEDDSLSLYIKGKNACEVLNCSPEILPLLISLNVKDDELRFINYAFSKGCKFNEIQFYNYSYFFGLDRDLLKCTKYTSLDKLIKYLISIPKEQRTETRLFSYSERGKLRYLASDYMDYISWCKELKYDLKNSMILFPKNFKDTHDEVSKIYQEHKDKLAKRALKRMETKYHKNILPRLSFLFEKSSDKYTVVVPTCKDDIVKEGHSLHHCVGGYAERVLKGETIIVFVRKLEQPDTSFFTCEINDNFSIRQLRGNRNKEAPKDVERFITKVVREAKSNDCSENSQRKAECA